MNLKLTTVLTALLVGTLSHTPSLAKGYPLMDGKCNEYRSLSVVHEQIASTTSLYIFEDDYYVWMCIDLPDDSFGTMDLRIHSPELAEELVLHVSAQLGQWPHGKPEKAPKTPSSEKWWNNEGWYSNTVNLNGTQKQADGSLQLKFNPSNGRELQLDKTYFGRGLWRMIFNLRGVNDASLIDKKITYPLQDSDQTKPVYYTFDAS